MAKVRPGDIVSIVNPIRNRVVNTGYINLRNPDKLSGKVPEGIPQNALKVIEDLIGWGILTVDQPEAISARRQEDPLDVELINEYKSLNARDAVSFLSSVGSIRRQRFLLYEKETKNRKSVLQRFSSV
jgi:hypothetical protein